MAIQSFSVGQVLTAAQVNALQANDYNQTVSNKTASYTLVAADKGTRVTMSSTSATTITVNNSLFSAGDTLFIQNLNSGVSTITAGTATVTTSASLALAQWEGGTLYFTSASAAIFFKSAGAAAGGGGKVLQVVQGTTSTDLTTTSTSYADTNLTASITPSLATSKVLVLISQQCYVSGSGTGENAAKYRLVRASTTILDYNSEFIKAKTGSGTAELGLNIGISYLDSPATTSSTTYKTMGASVTSGRNVQFQQSNLFPSSIVLLEIGA